MVSDVPVTLWSTGERSYMLNTISLRATRERSYKSSLIVHTKSLAFSTIHADAAFRCYCCLINLLLQLNKRITWISQFSIVVTLSRVRPFLLVLSHVSRKVIMPACHKTRKAGKDTAVSFHSDSVAAS